MEKLSTKPNSWWIKDWMLHDVVCQMVQERQRVQLNNKGLLHEFRCLVGVLHLHCEYEFSLEFWIIMLLE
jgi:hypothetical protein